MRLSRFFVAAALLAVPTAALAAPGIVTSPAGMRAGPGAGFPLVDRIPGGARVNVHGCVRAVTWCDVSWRGDRGWVAARNLEYFYRNHYVYLPDYVEVADVPIVPFVLGSYWSSYYSGRPFYHRQAYWNNYWRSNARFATQVPSGRSGRDVERRGAMTHSRQGGFARGEDVRGGRFARGVEEHGTRRDFRENRQPFAAAREGNRFEGRRFEGRGVEGRGFEGSRSHAGANREGAHFGPGTTTGRASTGPVGQPNAGRGGGAPAAFHAQPSQSMGAHGQMGGARAMGGGAPAHAMGGAPGGGGAPHINAAPRGGGGGPAAGGGAAAGPGAGGRGHHQ